MHINVTGTVTNIQKAYTEFKTYQHLQNELLSTHSQAMNLAITKDKVTGQIVILQRKYFVKINNQ